MCTKICVQIISNQVQAMESTCKSTRVRAGSVGKIASLLLALIYCITHLATTIAEIRQSFVLEMDPKIFFLGSTQKEALLERFRDIQPDPNPQEVRHSTLIPRVFHHNHLTQALSYNHSSLGVEKT